jgi:hypothetical protein
MTDISNLSYEELRELEKQVEERKRFLKQSKECAVGYKVTFCVKFNPYAHEYDDLSSVHDFGDWLVNEPTQLIIKHLGLKVPYEDVSGFEVVEMTDVDKLEWKGFWENEE